MKLTSNYYFSSFFWSTVSRVLNALFGFLAVPILLGLYGKADYGILALATSCNGYMQLLDLGMNTGAVKFFSQWKAQNKTALINRVANTNITFYFYISLINIIFLLILVFWGESWFNITHSQFQILQECLLILAIFNIINWETTPFLQLLTADKQIGFTMQMQSIVPLLKFVLIGATLYFQLSISYYFFFFTLIISLLIIPYIVKCKKDKLILSLRPASYWKDFNIVLKFSLSIFALSLFQATATQSRPIILSMFTSDGAGSVADFRILEVVPSFIVMLSSTFSGIFLPKAAEMVGKNDIEGTKQFAYKWTGITTVVVNILCFPFILGAKEALSAYVGPSFDYLSIWLIVWLLTVLVQMHTTAANSLVLAYGKTKILVIVTAFACLFSMILNVFLSKYIAVGSAVLCYFVYVVFIIGLYYLFFYKSLLHLSRRKMFMKFFNPSVIAFLAYLICCIIPFDSLDFWEKNRYFFLVVFIIKSCLWLILYLSVILIFKIIPLDFVRSGRT